jgi:hypothetical protein
MLVAALVLAGAGAAAYMRWRAAEADDPAAQLARANPGLNIRDSSDTRLQVSSPDGADRAYLHKQDAGPYDARLVSCDAVRAYLPAWLRLPHDAELTACLEIAADDRTEQVLNFTTALGIPTLWEEFYEPVVSAQGLGYHGGSASGPGTGGRNAPRSLSYGIDGPDGTDSAISVDAFIRDNRTLAVITVRRRSP